MTGDSMIELALRCYPRWWRIRYAEEMRSLVADLAQAGRSPVIVTLNLLRGALRARTGAAGMPMVYELWSARTRFSIATATVPWMVMGPLVLVAIGAQSLHSSAGRIFPPQLTLGTPNSLFLLHKGRSVAAPPLTTAGWTVWFAELAMTAVLVIGFIALFSGWSGLTGAIKRSAMPHRRRIALLAWTPMFSIVADIVLAIAGDVARPHSYHSSGGRLVPVGGHLAVAHALGTALGVAAAAGWVGSIVCVAVAARRADISPLDLRFGKSVSLVVAALFVLLFVAYATWSIALIVQARQAAHGTFTTISYGHQSQWLLMMGALFLVAAVSTRGALAARRSWRIIALAF